MGARHELSERAPRSSRGVYADERMYRNDELGVWLPEDFLSNLHAGEIFQPAANNRITVVEN